MANFDLNIIPLYRQAGKDRANLVGLHATSPPKRSARGRKSDQLIILLTFGGLSPFTEARVGELLGRLEKGFYDTPGSLTSASRDMIEELNSLILNINLRNAGSRPQITGAFSVLVVRNEDLYLAQSGPGHLFVLTPKKVEYINDPQAAGRGLGVSRTASIHFAQIPLLGGYRLLFTPAIPESWNAETFQSAHNRPLPVAHRRFMEHAGENVSAALVDVLPGKGAVNLIGAGIEFLPDEQPEMPAPRQIQQESWETVSPAEEAHQASPAVVEQPVIEPEITAPPQKAAVPLPKDREPRAEIPVYSTQPQPQTARKKRQTLKIGSAVLSGIRKTRAVMAKAFKGGTDFFQRMLPWEEMAQIPTSYAMFIAVAVPLIVITVAALVYVQLGQTRQFEYYLSQTENQVRIALAEEDADTQHQAWEDALGFVNAAEEYFVTEESTALRNQVVGALDDLDQITRLDFLPAVAGSMAGSIKIRQLITTNSEIYMLDIEHDQVYRARLVGDRYEMDPGFRCGWGRYGTLNVEGLIDIAPLPNNPDGAALIAIDSGGNLLYCHPDKPPVAIELVPPDNYFSDRIVGITLENENLYILDEGRNMVWFYTPSDESYQYRDAPYFFFQDEVPDMLNTIDFAVDREQLYLLYNNWQTTTCTFSTLEAAPTTCKEPEEYTDTRPGRESGPVIEEAVFYQVQHTQPPEPSLYYLDPINRSIYHFSLRLNLVEQYRPQEDLEEGLITAFSISPSRHVFIALENEIYISSLP
jgi:hypothetical protein